MKIREYRIEQDSYYTPVMVTEKEHDYYIGPVKITSASDAVELINHVFHGDYQAEEHVWMIALSASGAIKGVFEVAHGQLTQCAIGAREVYLRALLAGSASLVLAHNHPSGDISPSEADRICCERMQEAGGILGIRLLDFIIVGGNRKYLSFRDQALLDGS